MNAKPCRQLLTLAACLAALALPAVPLSAAGEAVEGESAYDAVQRSTKELLQKLREAQPIYEQDPERFYAAVDSALAPYIDFASFAKGVMARHYRDATPAQRAAFQKTFRDLLTRTYARALVGFDNERVQVLPPDEDDQSASAPDGARTVVKLEVHGSSGDVYPVQYQLVRREGRWLLRNLIVNGINIGLQFRSQFGASVKKYRKDIDLVIANWSVDVQRDDDG